MASFPLSLTFCVDTAPKFFTNWLFTYVGPSSGVPVRQFYNNEPERESGSWDPPRIYCEVAWEAQGANSWTLYGKLRVRPSAPPRWPLLTEDAGPHLSFADFRLNSERIEVSATCRNGSFIGEFARLLTRLEQAWPGTPALEALRTSLSPSPFDPSAPKGAACVILRQFWSATGREYWPGDIVAQADFGYGGGDQAVAEKGGGVLFLPARGITAVISAPRHPASEPATSTASSTSDAPVRVKGKPGRKAGIGATHPILAKTQTAEQYGALCEAFQCEAADKYATKPTHADFAAYLSQQNGGTSLPVSTLHKWLGSKSWTYPPT